MTPDQEAREREAYQKWFRDNYPDIPFIRNSRSEAAYLAGALSAAPRIAELEAALHPVAAAIKTKSGHNYHESDWNPDAHADEVILTVAEARAVLAAANARAKREEPQG